MSTKFQCRRCRHILFELKNVVNSKDRPVLLKTDVEGNHNISEEGDCKSDLWFLAAEDSPAWIQESIEQGTYTRGKLNCPKCSGRLGAFDFLSPKRCACQQHVSPPVRIAKNRVDMVSPEAVKSNTRVKHTTSYPLYTQVNSEYGECVTPSVLCDNKEPHLNIPSAAGELIESDGSGNGEVDLKCISGACSEHLSFGSANLPSGHLPCPVCNATGFIVPNQSLGPGHCESTSLVNDDRKITLDANDGIRDHDPESSSVTNTRTDIDINCETKQDQHLRSGNTDECYICGSCRKKTQYSQNIATFRNEHRDTTQSVPSSVNSSRGNDNTLNSPQTSDNNLSVIDLIPTVDSDDNALERLLYPEVTSNVIGDDAVGIDNRYSELVPSDEEGEQSDDKQEEDDQGEDEDPDWLTCPVCLDLYYLPYWCKPCDHIFCGPCLRKLRGMQPYSTKCPLCRNVIVKCFFHSEIQKTVKAYFPQKYSERHTNEKKHRKKLPPLPGVKMTTSQYLRSQGIQPPNGGRVLARGAGVCFVIMLMILGFTVFITTAGFTLCFLLETTIDILADLAIEINRFWELCWQVGILFATQEAIPEETLLTFRQSPHRLAEAFTRVVSNPGNSTLYNISMAIKYVRVVWEDFSNKSSNIRLPVSDVIQARIANYVIVGGTLAVIAYKLVKWAIVSYRR